MTKILAGQIWKECDPRFERFIRVESVGCGRRSVQTRTVIERDGMWIDAPNSRASYCDPERFNGKRGGYSLWRDV